MQTNGVTLQSLFSCTHVIFRKILLQKLLARMLQSSQIAGLFDHRYLWEKCINLLDFLHEAKSNIWDSFGWVFSCMPSHIQTCLDVVWVPFGDMPTLKIIQNERWIMSIGNKNVFPKFKSQNFKRKIASKTITVA